MCPSTNQTITFLRTDASKVGLSGILEQEIDSKRNVVEYSERSPRPNEAVYTASELECLEIVYSCQHYRHYLLGIQFTVETDHHSLCWLTSLNSPSGSLARWCISLSEFNFEHQIHKRKH